MRWNVVFGLVMVCACSPGETNEDSDSDTVANVDRGPTEIPLDADPNGLWWDEGTETLYIADDNGNRILKWTDAGGLAEVGVLPGELSGLGQVVKTADDKLVVPVFGFGAIGTVVWITADGATTGTVPDLDPEKRRIGLTVDASGQLYDGWFANRDSGRVGAVAKLSLDGSEVDLIEGLAKPIGVVVMGNTLYVSDQERDEILSKVLPDGPVETFAEIVDPDLLTPGPNGSLFTGSVDGTIYQIASNGAVSAFAAGTPETHGVAYDAANRRVFYAEHDPDESDGSDHALHIVPVE